MLATRSWIEQHGYGRESRRGSSACGSEHLTGGGEDQPGNPSRAIADDDHKIEG